MEAADADLDRIRAFAFEALPTIPDDLSAIERAIAEVGARLVIIDPLVAFFGRAVHAYRDHDVRRALTPLAALADRAGAAVLAIRHLNKTRMARAKYRGVGSIGIIGAARSALLVARDPEDPSRRLLAPVIEELSREAGSRFKVGKVDAESDPELAVRYKVSMLPTVLIFKHGDLVKTLVGVQRKVTLLNALQPAADNEPDASSAALAVGNSQLVE